MTADDARAILAQVRYEGWTFKVIENQGKYGRLLLQLVWVDTGAGLQHGRKWHLSRYMTRSEVVQTAFKAVLTAMEHEVREKFTYRGTSIFGPHFDVDLLVELCGRRGSLDVRK